jgi:hypothetical protein
MPAWPLTSDLGMKVCSSCFFARGVHISQQSKHRRTCSASLRRVGQHKTWPTLMRKLAANSMKVFISPPKSTGGSSSEADDSLPGHRHVQADVSRSIRFGCESSNLLSSEGSAGGRCDCSMKRFGRRLIRCSLESAVINAVHWDVRVARGCLASTRRANSGTHDSGVVSIERAELEVTVQNLRQGPFVMDPDWQLAS